MNLKNQIQERVGHKTFSFYLYRLSEVSKIRFVTILSSKKAAFEATLIGLVMKGIQP